MKEENNEYIVIGDKRIKVVSENYSWNKMSYKTCSCGGMAYLQSLNGNKKRHYICEKCGENLGSLI